MKKYFKSAIPVPPIKVKQHGDTSTQYQKVNSFSPAPSNPASCCEVIHIADSDMYDIPLNL